MTLSRFGTFTGLRTIRSGNYQPYPDLATWTFYGSAYASRYLTFAAVETRSNVLVSTAANPQNRGSYTTLQKLTGAEQAILNRYDKTWSQIAAALRNPASPAGQAILGAANYMTAAICQLTGDQPARACTPMVRKLLGP